jgi:ankyrin repeat protein
MKIRQDPILDETLEIEKTYTKLGENLVSAAHSGDLDKVKALLELKPNLDHPEKYYGSTALIFAARGGYSEIVKILLEHGATIDQANFEGYNPLIDAAWLGRLEVVKILLAWSADVNHASNNGDTALICANRYRHAEVVSIIEQHIKQMEKQIFDGIDGMNEKKEIYSIFPSDIKEIVVDYLTNKGFFKTQDKNQSLSQEGQKLAKKL